MNVFQKPRSFDGEETFTKEQVEAQIKGLKDNNAALLAEKHATKEKLTALEAQFAGIDPVQVKEMMSRFENDEEAKLIKDGKISEVVNARVNKAIEAANKKTQEALDLAEAERKRSAKFSQKVLDDSLRAGAMKAGMHEYAVEDALLHGRGIFQLDDEGNAVKIENGQTVIGKDGKTPFGPLELFEGLKETKKHWFPADKNSGSPSSDGGSGGSNQKTMKRSQFLALSPAEQAKMAKEVRIID